MGRCKKGDLTWKQRAYREWRLKNKDHIREYNLKQYLLRKEKAKSKKKDIDDRLLGAIATSSMDTSSPNFEAWKDVSMEEAAIALSNLSSTSFSISQQGLLQCSKRTPEPFLTSGNNISFDDGFLEKFRDKLWDQVEASQESWGNLF